MLILANTTDTFDLVTSSAATLDVTAYWTDYASGTATPGRSLAAISSATTSTIVASPASSTTRNLKTLLIRNHDAALACTVTVRMTVSGPTSYELFKVTLNPGDHLQWLENGNGFFVVRNANSPLANGANADQTLSSADTYLTPTLAFVGRIQVGTRFVWEGTFTKTAAGVATPIYQLRCGTAGTTADTSRASFTGVAQTGVADTAKIRAEAVVRTTGASGILQVGLTMIHNLAATGFANIANTTFQSTTAAFDLTVANSVLGWSMNPGASGVWTCKSWSYNGYNLLT